MQGENTSGLIFSSVLRELMRSEGITQVELARKVGVSQAAVSNWLNGAIPKGDQLWAIAFTLNVTMEWLLTKEGSHRPTFAVIKDGFIFARASFIWNDPAAAKEGEFQTREESRIRFQFLPPDDPWAVSETQQRTFCARYFKANDEQKREMLGLGGSAERTVGTRELGAIGVLMKRHLDGLDAPKIEADET